MSPLAPDTAAALTAALASGPEPTFAVLSGLFLAIPGVRAVTYLATAPDHSMVHRVGTSDATNFPLGGFDPIDDGPWCRRIFGEMLPIIGNTPAEIAPFIPETEDLVAMGFGSTMCAPIVIAGQVRGTVNLLGDAGIFTPASLSAINAVLPLTALVFAFKGIDLKS